MRRYIDEKTGKIVNILEKEEANKVVKILIDYFFSGENMPAGRLNLVGFLRDFIKLGDIEDLNEIVGYIGEYKKGLKLPKEEEENFEVLYKFFRMYKDLEESKVGIEEATNYISEMATEKEEIAKKQDKDMTKKDRILKVFFDNGFEFKRLAKVACDTWVKHLEKQMQEGKKEIFVSLEEEIAYQDLLEFATSESDEEPKVEKVIEKKQESKTESNEKEEKNEVKDEEKTDEKLVEKETEKVSEKDEKKEEKLEEKVEEKIDVKVENVDKEVKEEKNTLINDKKEEKVHSIHINTVFDDKKEEPKVEVEVKKQEINPALEPKKEEKVHSIQINHMAGELHEDMLNRNFMENKSEVHPKPQTPSNQNRVSQAEINSLLGLDDDMASNSNRKEPSLEKKEEKIHTIEINHMVEDTTEKSKSQSNEEDKTRRENGYVSNIQIVVPGSEEKKQPETVNSNDVKKATENVNLKDSVNFFNDVLDNRISRNSFLDDSEDGFRD